MPYTYSVDVKQLAHDNSMTLVVKLIGVRQWTIRLWIAKQLITLAAWIAWLDVRFED